MNNPPVAHYTGTIASAFDQPLLLNQLSDISALVKSPQAEKLSGGADYVIKVPLRTTAGEIIATVKVFKRQSFLKDWYDKRHGSKAERSFRAAMYLHEKGIGTPSPIAWREYWVNGRLLESYYVCLFEPGISFRDALADIYYNQHDNAPLMELLHLVAPAIKAMHDAGFMHGDMGNQNILLPKDQLGQWQAPQFIDLNRATYSNGPLNIKQRAFDLARIALPGAYLKIFKTIYNNHQDFSKDFEKQEQKARKRFWGHRRSSKWRHPIRHWRNQKRSNTRSTYPPPQDIWLWDEKSAQPMIVLGRKEKHKYRKWGYMLSMMWQSAISAPGIYKRYRQLLKQSYQQPLSMHGRVGVALHPKAEYLQHELPLLKALGNIPVLIRFAHHETHEDWRRGIALVEDLHKEGVEIMVAILQDRQAVLHPEQWSDFLEIVIGAIADKVAHIEVTHASNRVKWGVWSAQEYGALIAPAFALQQRYPHIKLTGPACIDFEYHPVIAALNAIPFGNRLNALSHLLYVDRRGAPESKQGHFATLEKCALLKAVAQWSDRCDDKVIVSEVNWPVKYTGIWSPIGCPYTTPKWRREEPGETEEDYANYMLRYLVIALCSGYVDQVFWWRLSAHGYGLVDDLDNFRQRPAFKALQIFTQLLGRADFICKLPSDDSVYLMEFQTAEHKIIMGWTEQGVYPRPSELQYSYALDRDGNTLSDVNFSGAPVYLIRNV